jgi:AraC family ethanolamine operon transcriptional activator
VGSAAGLELIFDSTSECIQLTPGTFSGIIESGTAQTIRSKAFSVNRGFQLRAEVPPGRMFVGFVSMDQRSPVISRGRPLGTDAVVVVSGADALIVAQGATTMTWLDVDLASIAPGVYAAVSANSVVPVSPEQSTVLRSHARRILSRSAYEPSHELTGVLLALLREARAYVEPRSLTRRIELVRRAEEFMWNHIEEPQSLTRVCDFARCKLRTLIYAFKVVVGMSPMKYFKIQRLNAVRRKLSAKDNAMHIFCVAADCGFWHMGHFGSDYKALFGLAPSTERPLAT